MILYLITDGEFMKIGVSTNIETRLRELQGGNARKLRVLHVMELPRSRIWKVERKAHKNLHHRHVRLEWFSCSEEEAVSAMNCALACPRSTHNRRARHREVKQLRLHPSLRAHDARISVIIRAREKSLRRRLIDRNRARLTAIYGPDAFDYLAKDWLAGKSDGTAFRPTLVS